MRAAKCPRGKEIAKKENNAECLQNAKQQEEGEKEGEDGKEERDATTKSRNKNKNAATKFR